MTTNIFCFQGTTLLVSLNKQGLQEYYSSTCDSRAYFDRIVQYNTYFQYTIREKKKMTRRLIRGKPVHKSIKGESNIRSLVVPNYIQVFHKTRHQRC